MSTRTHGLRSRLAVAAAVTVLGLGSGTLALVIAPGVSHASSIPPWEPDAQSVGGLVFYNSSGDVITGGNTTDQPVAAYVEGTTIIRDNDTKAVVYGFLPVDGQLPSQWSGEALGASTVYPNGAAPAPLTNATLPVETGSAKDESISNLASDFPNNDSSSDGYANMYQLRLYTTAPQESVSTSYDSADIEISGSTWSVVYSQSPQVTTTTQLAVSATVAHYGASVQLNATVTPTDATGSVAFFDGTKQVVSVAVVSGSAAFADKTLTDGTHALSARFVPTTPADFTGSTSTNKTVVVSATATTTSLKASKTSTTLHQPVTLTATESPAATGAIAFYDGAKKLSTVKVVKGSAKYSTSALAVGTHTLKAEFLPSSTAADKTSTSKTIKVTVKK
jgi:hypothetical protein